MQRELKFRFWDQSDKRWLFNSCNVGHNGGAYDLYKNEHYKDVVVQQFVGLNLNGKDISTRVIF